MNKKNMIIILCTAVAVVLAVVMILSFAGKDAKNDIAEQKTENADNSASEQDANAVEENNGNEEKKTENVPAQEDSPAVPVQTEEVKVNPTFMYFVDNSQETETAAMIEELKAAYPDVVFDIKNVEIYGSCAVAGDLSCDTVRVSGHFAAYDVEGDVITDGNISCGNIRGDLNVSNGNINCGNISGDIYCEGNISCNNLTGDINSDL